MMSSSDKEKVDQLFAKLKSLGDRAKSTRAQFGSPLVDRVLERVGRISQKLPQHNGNSQPQQPQQEPKVVCVCPQCGKAFLEDIAFCSGCGFSFQEQRRKQQHEELEREKLVRTSTMSIK